jgi:hypothetical protein
MKWIIIFIIFAFLSYIYICIRFINTPSPFNEVITSPSNRITPRMISEKLPIVLTDPITDITKFINTVYLYQQRYKSRVEVAGNQPNIVRNLRLFLHNNGDNRDNNNGVIIYIAHPKYATLTDNPTEITLKRGQIAIIPRGWHYMAKSADGLSAISGDSLLSRYF